MSPVMASYYVTYRCNAKCPFCVFPKNNSSNSAPLVPMEKAKSILTGLRQIGVRYVDFTGGEPLLEKNLPELLRIAKSLGMATAVATNGYLYPKRADELKGLIDTLGFSLDSPNIQEHNDLRGIDCFDRVIEGIKTAKENGHVVNINFSAGNENIDSLPEMVKLAQKNKVLIHIMPVFSYFGNPSLQGELTEKIKKYFKEPYVSMNLAALELHKKGGNDIKKPKCKAVKSVVAISPDGYLLLPCYHSKIKSLKIEDDLPSLYKSEEVKKVKKQAGRYDFCSGCSIWCYIGPSFFYSLDKYFFLQLYSYLQGSSGEIMRGIKGMSANKKKAKTLSRK